MRFSRFVPGTSCWQHLDDETGIRMTVWQMTLLAVAISGAHVQADPPPPRAELDKLLQEEPIDAKNWPVWSGRLREGSAEHFDAAWPAFNKAFDFARKNESKFPKNMQNDAVAWMVLAGSYVHDAKSSLGPVARGREAATAASKSIR